MKESAWDDPIVEETRRVRQEIAAEFGGDVGALGEYFKAMRAADVARQLAEFLKQAPAVDTMLYQTAGQEVALAEEPVDYDVAA
jgi:hypothetical protein